MKSLKLNAIYVLFLALMGLPISVMSLIASSEHIFLKIYLLCFCIVSIGLSIQVMNVVAKYRSPHPSTEHPIE